MRTLDVLVAVFAGYMLLRHGPRAVALLRGPPEGRPGAVVALVNVALAIALLVLAGRGLLGRLTFR